MASSGSHRRFSHSLHEPPPLPSDVIPEILSKLPMKVSHKFRCVCKSWNSLISDPKFVKKQLHIFTNLNLHFLNYAIESGRYILTSYPLESVFTNITSNFTKSEYFSNHFNGELTYGNLYCIIGSCNGLVCIADDHKGLVILWNPSTREFKELPLCEKPHLFYVTDMTFAFGYDSLNNNYKVVVILNYCKNFDNEVEQVKILTLGTNVWRTIHEFPFRGVPVPVMGGKFVSGTVNWLFSKELSGEFPCFIVSFNLANESFQKISPPNLGGVDVCDLSDLSVLRDCLCVTTSGDDVWIMKEYGNKESWTKLFNIPNMRDHYNSHVYSKPIYIFDDDQMLLRSIGDDVHSTLVLYDPTSGTLRSTKFKYIPEVCGESLISPCSLC